MKLWMYVDKLSFPIEVADSCRELAERLGVNPMTIRTIAHRTSTGEFKNGKYVCVDVGEDETEEEVNDAINSALQGRKKGLRVCGSR